MNAVILLLDMIAIGIALAGIFFTLRDLRHPRRATVTLCAAALILAVVATLLSGWGVRP